MTSTFNDKSEKNYAIMSLFSTINLTEHSNYITTVTKGDLPSKENYDKLT